MGEQFLADNFSTSLGGLLRSARRQRGWSLGEVETFTSGEFKASVVGAYERGERAISVQRFVRLADLYGVNAADLLPSSTPGESRVIDLTKLGDGQGNGIVERYLAAIQLMRKDRGGGEVRDSDKAVISTLLDADADVANSRLK